MSQNDMKIECDWASTVGDHHRVVPETVKVTDKDGNWVKLEREDEPGDICRYRVVSFLCGDSTPKMAPQTCTFAQAWHSVATLLGIEADL